MVSALKEAFTGRKVIFDGGQGNAIALTEKYDIDGRKKMKQEKVYIGENLRVAMAKKHMTQMELAKKVGTEQCVISRYCNNLATPSTTILLNISKALKVSADYLLTGKEFKGGARRDG